MMWGAKDKFSIFIVKVTFLKIRTYKGIIRKFLNRSAIHVWGLKHAPYAYLTNLFRGSVPWNPFPLPNTVAYTVQIAWQYLFNIFSSRYKYRYNNIKYCICNCNFLGKCGELYWLRFHHSFVPLMMFPLFTTFLFIYYLAKQLSNKSNK
jgi:hypothetical protein